MKKHVLSVIACGLVSLAMVNGAQAQNLAVVNGKAIPMTQYDQILQQLQKNGQQPTDEIKARLKKELITRAVLIQAADAAGVTKSPDYQRDLDSAKDAIAINLFMKDKANTFQVSDQDAKAEYDKFAKANGGKEYQADHILVKTEKEAKDIIAKLNKDKGANFAALAKKHSIDTGSATNGGSLGWANPNNYVPAFAKALEALKKGQYTEMPVQTQFGYHIIKLDDVRAAPLPKFDDVKQQIIQQIKQQKLAAFQEQLVKDAKVE